MPNESKNQNQKSSSKLVVVIVVLLAAVGILWMLSSKSKPVVLESMEANTVQSAAVQDSAPKRPTPEAQPMVEEEEHVEPEFNAESTWMIEDFTDTKKSWANYKMTNVRVTPNGIELAPGATEGTFESPPMTLTIPANMVAPLWKQEVPKNALVTMEMRISGDGQNWSSWYPLDDTGDDISPLYPDGTPNPNYGHVPGAYISTGLDLSAFTQYRINLSTTGGEDREYRMPDGSFANTLRVPGLRIYVSDSTLGEGKMITAETMPPGVPEPQPADQSADQAAATTP